MQKTHALFIMMLIFFCSVSHAFAQKVVPSPDWSFEKPLGRYDRAALERGFEVYKKSCAACHGLSQLRYRDLSALGYNENEIREMAAEYIVMDGPDEEGNLFERSALPKDPFVSPYENEQQAAFLNNGIAPVDLSLYIKSKENGEDYLYSILTGYSSSPLDNMVSLSEGQYWNYTFKGHVISMAPPLSDGLILYEDGTPATVQNYAADVVTFLAWAASPDMEDRKRMGIKVILYLIAFALVLYGVRIKTWSALYKNEPETGERHNG